MVSSSLLRREKDECLQSAGRVAKMMQRDDMVIFLWSIHTYMREQTLNSLSETRRHDLLDQRWAFYAEYVRHPKSGDKILFISAPTPDCGWDEELRTGLRVLQYQTLKIGVRHSTHVWLHDISVSGAPGYTKKGALNGWKLLKEANFVDQMGGPALLTIFWDKIGPKDGQRWEKTISEVLKSELQKGLAHLPLPSLSKVEAWCAIGGIIDMMQTASTQAEGIGDASKWLKTRVDELRESARKKAEEDKRVRSLQSEINEIYTGLYKTEYGRSIRTKLRKVFDDQERMMTPLLNKLERTGIKSEEREAVENLIKEEYGLFVREFRGYFAEIKAMGIEIGVNIQDFYGFLEIKRSSQKKKEISPTRILRPYVVAERNKVPYFDHSGIDSAVCQ
ncbi:hypothetical protein NP233_g1372 [Leucocoprinus birnbaumii]|uniref:Uncharacterized protein n=1 Tax=Leucocoprinus birnbaumii TaxID=56174 RepID=A0AAD5W0M6_9AGAR|nr:hypothetical protein NP233_g1372 [Leucocoprinus birnbaumii]